MSPETARPDSYYDLLYGNRTLCSVLEEMRQCTNTLSFGNLMGLIEEAQSLGNRMEAGLERKKAIRDGDEYRRALREEILELEKARDALKPALKPAPEKAGGPVTSAPVLVTEPVTVPFVPADLESTGPFPQLRVYSDVSELLDDEVPTEEPEPEPPSARRNPFVFVPSDFLD